MKLLFDRMKQYDALRGIVFPADARPIELMFSHYGYSQSGFAPYEAHGWTFHGFSNELTTEYAALFDQNAVKIKEFCAPIKTHFWTPGQMDTFGPDGKHWKHPFEGMPAEPYF